MDVYHELRKKIYLNFPHGDVFGDEYFDDSIFSLLESDSINNAKGITDEKRFLDIISDPSNLFIKRNPNAGKCDNGIVWMHNGIRIHENSYYGKFSDIFKINLGSHEPSQERAFQYVLNKMPVGASMIELGSYWCFYSIWFQHLIKNAKVYAIEPNENFIKLGIKNYRLNNLIGKFTKGFISNEHLNLAHFMRNKNINYLDLLHSDIQGYELVLLRQISELLKEKRINYIFLSTHSDALHFDCIKFLIDKGYRIICECDFEKKTFEYDGFVLACPESNQEIKSFRLGNRSKSLIISKKIKFI